MRASGSARHPQAKCDASACGGAEAAETSRGHVCQRPLHCGRALHRVRALGREDGLVQGGSINRQVRGRRERRGAQQEA
eukprot:863859-Prymnesium_polylepis.1